MRLIDLADFLLVAEATTGRAGLTWTAPVGGQQEIACVIEALAAGEITEHAFIGWVAERAGEKNTRRRRGPQRRVRSRG